MENNHLGSHVYGWQLMNGDKDNYDSYVRSLEEELKFTRQFIIEHDLMYALYSAWERRKGANGKQ